MKIFSTYLELNSELHVYDFSPHCTKHFDRLRSLYSCDGTKLYLDLCSAGNSISSLHSLFVSYL